MKKSELLLPSLRCAMGDWMYYVTSLRFSEIAERVASIKDLHESTALNEQLQRDLSARGSQISKYLLNSPQRFFNALTIAVYGGEPQWLDIALSSSKWLDRADLAESAIERIDTTLGLLRLSGEEKLFALDGQHRVSGIKLAMQEDAGLADEEVCVVLVGHQNTDQGIIRSRRLFTTLNRYAKSVSKSDIVALDEDDASAIVTRRLLNEHRLLTGNRTATGPQTSLPRTDKESFTTIVTAYEIANILLQKANVGSRIWTAAAIRGPRPEESDLNLLYDYCAQFWDALIEVFPPIRELADSNPTASDVASRYRTSAGGHVLFRPVGQMAFAKAVRELVDRGDTVLGAVQRFASVNFELSDERWSGVLWNSAANTMLSTSTHRDVSAELMLYLSGTSLDKKALLVRYRALLDDKGAQLPSLK